MTSNDLAVAERRAFRSVVDTGLVDVMLASVVAMFAIAPMLSSRLGDFWSSAVFVPVWVVVYLICRLVRERYLVPRVGVVLFGAPRLARLRTAGVVLLIVNVIALAAGALFNTRSSEPSTWAFPVGFSLIVLSISSLASYAYDIPRVFVYGVLLATAPAIGEWLFRNGYAAHHGFPIVFGVISTAIAAIGIAKLTAILRQAPPGAPDVSEGPAPVGNHD